MPTVATVPFAEIPLTEETIDAVRARWPQLELRAVEPDRLYGGEESAAYRIDHVVVRIGPTWRSSDDAEWCHAIAAAASVTVPEAIAPLQSRRGTTVERVAGRPISIWPYVEGRWPDEDNDHLFTEAARLLARLHRALRHHVPPIRPAPSAPMRNDPTTEDSELDRWLEGFAGRHPDQQPLHGDYYAGNLLVREGRLVAVLDWDEAFVSPAERELAWAACEWGDVLWQAELRDAREFIEIYTDSGGPAGGVTDLDVAQLYRQRLRSELAYAAAAEQRGAMPDADDLEYHQRQRDVFRQLRP